MEPISEHNPLGTTSIGDELHGNRPLKDFLVGPRSSNPVTHGWTSESVLFNHLDENIEKVMAKPELFFPPELTAVAVIISRDRPINRAAGADTIADTLDELKIANKDEFVVIPATPKAGDPTAPILPHINIIICDSVELVEKLTKDNTKAVIHTQRKDGSDGFSFYIFPAVPEPSWYIGCFVGLSDRITRNEFISSLFDKLISDRTVIRMIQEHHDRVPDARDIPFVVRVLLEYTEIKVCQVYVPGRQGRAPERQNAIRLYMPTPSLEPAAVKDFKDYLTSPTFSFVVDCRGRGTVFRGTRGGRPRPMECAECLGIDHYKEDCPIATSPEFLAVHLTEAELDSTRVGTTLASIGVRDITDTDGFKTVTYRNKRNSRGGGYGGYRGGRPRGRARTNGRNF
ncbi:hypothetical protein C8R45DRAFT_996789 [Mycena sanguinolenta]|nr:hypothetical protein C8R45DRAFT_996789 [Mycena sanguinolenta]